MGICVDIDTHMCVEIYTDRDIGIDINTHIDIHIVIDLDKTVTYRQKQSQIHEH